MIIYNKLSNPSNYYSSYTRSTSSIKWIVIHYTGNDGDTAKANANYFANNVVKASAHYFVDDNCVYRSVPDNYTAWSVGGSKYNDCSSTGGGKYHGQCTNANSISIELCDTVRNGKLDVTYATLRNAADLTRSLMNKYNIDINHVICHFDVTGKRCPNFNNGAWILGERRDWKKFKAMLEEDDMTADEVRKIVREEIDAALKGYKTKPSKWAEEIVKEAVALGISADGERPKGYLTREEGMAMSLKAVKISEDDGK
jgi:N-acetylmuramoyl-L-alanine amidase CwlA